VAHLRNIVKVQQQRCVALEAVGSGQQRREGILMRQEVLTWQVTAAAAAQQQQQQQQQQSSKRQTQAYSHRVHTVTCARICSSIRKLCSSKTALSNAYQCVLPEHTVQLQ
jgi:hypothetical protein